MKASRNAAFECASGTSFLAVGAIDGAGGRGKKFSKKERLVFMVGRRVPMVGLALRIRSTYTLTYK